MFILNEQYLGRHLTRKKIIWRRITHRAKQALIDSSPTATLHLPRDTNNARPYILGLSIIFKGRQLTRDGHYLSPSECQNFPGNTIPGQKISRRNVPGQENSGTRKFQEFHFFPEFKKYFFEKIPGFFPAGAENSRTFNPT